jgi:hypothetical protein
MWVWYTGKCVRYVQGECLLRVGTPEEKAAECTHWGYDPVCSSPLPGHAGVMRDSDAGWRCAAHPPCPQA